MKDIIAMEAMSAIDEELVLGFFRLREELEKRRQRRRKAARWSLGFTIAACLALIVTVWAPWKSVEPHTPETGHIWFQGVLYVCADEPFTLDNTQEDLNGAAILPTDLKEVGCASYRKELTCSKDDLETNQIELDNCTVFYSVYQDCIIVVERNKTSNDQVYWQFLRVSE